MKKYPSQSEEWNAVIDHTIFFMKSFVNISYDNKKKYYALHCNSSTNTITIHSKECSSFTGNTGIKSYSQGVNKYVVPGGMFWLYFFDSFEFVYLFCLDVSDKIISCRPKHKFVSIKFHDEIFDHCGTQSEIDLLKSMLLSSTLLKYSE